MMNGLFTNGTSETSVGEKLSFGRVSAAAVIAFGLLLITGTVIMEEIHPSTPVSVIETQIVKDAPVTMTSTVLVANHNWPALGGFLITGIAPLSGLMYTGGKIAQAIQTKVEK